MPFMLKEDPHEVDDITVFNFQVEIPLVNKEMYEGFPIESIPGTTLIDSVEIQELGCVSQLMYNYQMSSKPLDALKSVFEYYDSHSQTELHPYFIKISDEAFYSKHLLNKKEFALKSLEFGTLLPNLEFLAHWVINYEDEASEWKNFLETKFVATFNFDDNALLLVNVWTYLHQDEDKKYDEQFEHFTLTIERKQLQRIIVCHSNTKTKIFLETSYPSSIKKRIIPIDKDKLKKTKEQFKRYRKIYRGRNSGVYPKEGVLAENRYVMLEFAPMKPFELYQLVYRIFARTHVPVEFSRIQTTYSIYSSEGACPYLFDEDTDSFDQSSYFDEKLCDVLPGDKNKDARFKVTYLLYALLSHGAIVKDQLLRDRTSYESFCDFVLDMTQKNYTECLRVLESLVRFLAMTKRHDFVINILKMFYEAALDGSLSVLPYDKRLANMHFEKIGVIVVTPTKILFKCPEIHMGNTVSRYLKNNTLLIEDDGILLRSHDYGEKQFEKIIASKMDEGIKIYDRVFKFFGSSGSQLKEMGMYFMEESLIAKTWEFLGDFEKIDNMYRRIAREGQNLTQSRRCQVYIKRDMWDVVKDFKSKDSKFCFSDGCGMISLDLWKEMCNDLEIDGMPCAFQFRFLGFKGMLAVDPNFEGRVIKFRDSQYKFIGREEGYMEVVKESMPQSANLSRPFINILCQNSQSNAQTHERILNRILDLYENMFMNLALAMIDEKKFRAVLKDLPYIMDIDYLSEEHGFVLHQEPFFKSLVVSYIKQKLEQQINKISLPMPHNLGRSLFGVVDETGLLEPGQVFVQWTDSMRNKISWSTPPGTILEGKVTVTKNPCMASGDVRIFEAVNHKELAERYWDVIVFPNHGNKENVRPHPDEMAGSDLDGDEYTVLCDDELLLDRNEEAFDFASDGKTVEKKNLNDQDENERKTKRILDLFQNSKIGIFSDAQLTISDLFGIQSKGSLNLIKKASMALDFAKSGTPPEELTTVWKRDPVTKEMIPPEKSSRRPDFKKVEENGPTYASSRINGIIHRSNRQLTLLLTVDEKEIHIEMNPIFIDEYNRRSRRISEEELKQLEEEVMQELNTYNARVRGIKDAYGIKTEGELFSGCILQMINKLTEREEDDGSNFTTTKVVEKLVSDVFKEYREKFFQNFGGWERATKYRGKREEWESKNVLKRIVTNTPDLMILKALMYYRLAYEKAKEGEKLFSFGLLAWDVLARTQERFNSRYPDFPVGREDFYEILSTSCSQFLADKQVELNALREMGNHPEGIRNIQQIQANYGESSLHVLFILKDWARRCGLINADFSERDFLFFVFLTASDHFYEEVIFDATNSQGTLHLGETISAIMKRLASRQTMNEGKKLMKGNSWESQWEKVYDSARKSFYSLYINQRFEEFLGSPAHMECVERETMIIELPDPSNSKGTEMVSDELICKKLMEKTGATEMLLARKDKNRNYVTVLYRGNSDTVEKLCRLVQLDPTEIIRRKKSQNDMDRAFAEEVYKNIMA